MSSENESEQREAELKDCPFCGSKPGSTDLGDDVMGEIFCATCDITMMASAVSPDLVSAWNRRALSEPAYRAEFLWPPNDDTPEEYAYELANASTEEYARECWGKLKESLSEPAAPPVPKDLAKDAIEAMDDLMGEATGGRPVQDWGRVNDVMIRMQAIVDGERRHD